MLAVRVQACPLPSEKANSLKVSTTMLIWGSDFEMLLAYPALVEHTAFLAVFIIICYFYLMPH